MHGKALERNMQSQATETLLMTRTGELQIVRAQLDKSTAENIRLAHALATAKQDAQNSSSAQIVRLREEMAALQSKLRFSLVCLQLCNNWIR